MIALNEMMNGTVSKKKLIEANIEGFVPIFCGWINYPRVRSGVFL